MQDPDSALRGLSILVVEDELLLRKQLAAGLEALGADVTSASSLDAARRFLGELNFDCALIDVNLPDGQGTDLLRDKSLPAGTGAIVMTAHGAVAGAVDAMRLGALDYLVKPFEPAELQLVLNRVRRAQQSARINEHERNEQPDRDFVFGRSLAPVEAQLSKILAADERVRGTPPPALILGETGTGKTSIARWLHRHGPRAAQPLVEVNCSALPETLAESELFGHEKGAFTDARSARLGLFEAANGGSLFLDELPSLSPLLQAKVLTAIEDHTIRRLGGNRTIHIDVRVIAASNRDLKTLVGSGGFREDLYHRLDLFRIQLPPLRQRAEDILDMAEVILRRLCKRHGVPVRRVSPRGRQRLLAYAWPGNVRELSHEIERAIVFAEEDELEFEQLPVGPVAPRAEESSPLPTGQGWFNAAFAFPPEGFSLEEAVTQLIQRALKQSGGNVSAAARLLGVSRDYVRYRLSATKQ